MIISASRRTDIPAYYSDWFYNRIREGFVCVRNPMNFHQVSRISLSLDVVDGIVFWTKNPLPLMPRLKELQAYPFYFQFTLTPYGKDVEPVVPSKNDVILPAFQELSRRIGPERVIWRYDPILFTERYTMDYHITFFSLLARRLEGYTRKCIISFVDLYRNTQTNMNVLGFEALTEKEIVELAQRLADIAGRHHLVLETCAEQIDLSPYIALLDSGYHQPLVLLFHCSTSAQVGPKLARAFCPDVLWLPSSSYRQTPFRWAEYAPAGCCCPPSGSPPRRQSYSGPAPAVR